MLADLGNTRVHPFRPTLTVRNSAETGEIFRFREPGCSQNNVAQLGSRVVFGSVVVLGPVVVRLVVVAGLGETTRI